MTINLISHLDQPNCADPAFLPIVDAAFNARGPATERMRREVCAGCPAARKCFDLGMANPVHGVWGTVNQSIRVKHGAPDPTPSAISASGERDALLGSGIMGRRHQHPAA